MKRLLNITKCLVVTFLLMSFSLVYAQSENISRQTIDYQIPQTSSSPVIDGEFSLSEWGDALMIPLHNETHPTQNIPALVDTEVYIMENGEDLLLAFVAHDPEPGKIRAFYRDRDQAWQDDFVGVVLDTFNDERRAYEFFVSPLGMQMDLTNDDVSGNEDASWNAVWDSAGKINDSGFVVEMRIPHKQMRMPSDQELQIWGIDLLRFYPRDERHRLSNNLTDYSVSCYLCLLTKASGLPNLKQSTNLQITPTVTTLWSENRPDPVVDSWASRGVDYDGGVDIRWGINEDMILNATINPDFSQVESDNAQLDVNNTFTLFFAERREFFLDGAEYFNTQLNLVHTRNIQEPDAGIKLTGKNGDHTYGILLANDQRTAFVVPGLQGSRVATLADTSSEDMVLRYRYDYGRNITVGSLLTHRRASDYDNTLGSMDLNWRFTDSDRLNAQFMFSNAHNPEEIQTSFNLKESQSDYALRMVYSHNGENFGLNLRAFSFGEDFRADLGSINKVGFTHINMNPNYVWRMKPDSFLTQIGLWGFAGYIEDLDGVKQESNQRVGIWLSGPMQSNFEVGFGPREKLYNGTYYDTSNTYFWFQLQPWGGAQFSINVDKGHTIDYANSRQAESTTMSPNFSLQLGRHLRAQVGYTYQSLDVSGGELYNTQLADFRLTYQFSRRSFLRAILISSDTERNTSLYNNSIDAASSSLSTQLLYSYRFNARTRFFIGYSDSAIENDQLVSLGKTNRTVFAKFSYAWQY